MTLISQDLLLPASGGLLLSNLEPVPERMFHVLMQS